MKPWAILFGVIALAIAAAALALRPPAPLPASAPPQAFSAARALPDVYAIAQRPHPIRSAEQSRVRDVLFGRMVDVVCARSCGRSIATGARCSTCWACCPARTARRRRCC